GKAEGGCEAPRAKGRGIPGGGAGRGVPFPRRGGSGRAGLFLIVDDHSRLLMDGRFYGQENAGACQGLLRRAVTRRGLPEVLYCDYAGAGIMPTLGRKGCSVGAGGRKVSA